MRAFASLVIALVLAASASWSAELPGYGGGTPGGSARVHPVQFTSKTPAGIYSIGLAFPVAVMDFDLGSAFSGVLYACTDSNVDRDNDGVIDATASCDSLSTLSADTSLSAMRAYKLWYVIDINTAESAGNVSTLTIKGSFDSVSSGSSGPIDTLTGAASGTLTGDINGLTTIEFGDGYRDMIETTIASPKWVAGSAIEPYFNINGIKANCPTATKGADPAKPWLTCPSTGILKTKTSGLYMTHTNLTPSEAWPLSINMVTGGDTDPNGIGMFVKASGGSQTGGDEGINGMRIAITPNWGNAFGTASIPATTGDFVSIPLSGTTTDNSQYIGVGKPLVFSGSSSAFTATPAAQPTATVIVGNPKLGTAKVDWTTTTSILAAGAVADNWCVSHDAYNYTTPGTGTTSRYWLKISAIDPSGTSFSTEHWAQGVDQKYPDSHLWSLAANSLSFAPCYTINGVSQDPATKLTNAVTVYKTDGYSEAGSIAWDVVPYGEFKMTGVKVLMTADVNPTSNSYAFAAQNELDFRGRHALGAGYRIEGPSCATNNRSTSCIKDGRKGAFDYGLDIAEWGANVGFRFKYAQGDDLGAGHVPFYLDPPAAANDWGAPYVGIPVMQIDANPDKTLIVDSARGWGVGQQGSNLGYFAVVDGAVTHANGNLLKWSSSDSSYIEVGGASPFVDYTQIGDAEEFLINLGTPDTMDNWNRTYSALDSTGATYTVDLPEITSTADRHKRVEIFIEPGVVLTVRGHTNDRNVLGWNAVTTGPNAATMTFTAPATYGCKADIVVRQDNQVWSSSTCPTQAFANP